MPVLYVLSRTDALFPPSLAPEVMGSLRDAGVDATYCEIDSELGHLASGADAAKWAPALRDFMRRLRLANARSTAMAGTDPAMPAMRSQAIVICVKSCDQLCAGLKPVTFFDIARGLRSCTMNSHGASSTTMACACVSSRAVPPR